MSSSGKIAQRLVLKDNHSTSIKVAKLCDLANELGISFHFHSGGVVVTDTARDEGLPSLHLEDIEEGHHFTGFPFETEYKLVYENPAYITQLKKENDERERRYAEHIRLEKEKAEAKRKEEEARRARELEAGERLMLAKLKEKYE